MKPMTRYYVDFSSIFILLGLWPKSTILPEWYWTAVNGGKCGTASFQPRLASSNGLYPRIRVSTNSDPSKKQKSSAFLRSALILIGMLSGGTSKLLGFQSFPPTGWLLFWIFSFESQHQLPVEVGVPRGPLKFIKNTKDPISTGKTIFFKCWPSGSSI